MEGYLGLTIISFVSHDGLRAWVTCVGFLVVCAYVLSFIDRQDTEFCW